MGLWGWGSVGGVKLRLVLNGVVVLGKTDFRNRCEDRSRVRRTPRRPFSRGPWAVAGVPSCCLASCVLHVAVAVPIPGSQWKALRICMQRIRIKKSSSHAKPITSGLQKKTASADLYELTHYLSAYCEQLCLNRNMTFHLPLHRSKCKYSSAAKLSNASSEFSHLGE